MTVTIQAAKRRFLFTGAFILAVLWISVPPEVNAMMSIKQEKEMRQQLLQMVKNQVPIIDDPDIIGYVSELGHRVLEQVPVKFFDYQFFVIKDDGLNAFAMPGGLIFVHTGLIENIESDDELVCVLAHEIGHVQGRHIARRMDRMKKVNIATAAMAIASLFLGSSEATSALLASSQALNASIALKYSRSDEEEADRRAYQWICRAGYNPLGLVKTLKKMDRYRWLGTDAIPSYLSTHPGGDERITYLEDLARHKPCKIKSYRDPFRLKEVQVEIKAMTHEPAVLIREYRKKIKENPDDLFALQGLALSLIKARDYEEALRVYDRLIKLAGERHEFRVDQARAYFAAGRYTRAATLLEQYTMDHPGDLTARFYLAKSYLEDGKPGKALSVLKKLEKKWHDPLNYYLETGRCYAAMDRPGEAHYYLYLYYRTLGNIATADYHKRRAKEILPSNSKLYSRLMDYSRQDPKHRKNTSEDRDDMEKINR